MHGDANVGSIAQPDNNYFEYIGACLISPLQAGTTYTFNLDIAAATDSAGTNGGDTNGITELLCVPTCDAFPIPGFGYKGNDYEVLATAGLVNDGEDAHEIQEIVLCTAGRTAQHPEGGRRTTDKDDDACSATTNASAINCTTTMDGDPVVDLFAGGGHSAALTGRGRLYLWGWNESGQLGTSAMTRTIAESSSLLEIAELGAIRVRTAALGFSHTLVIERETGRLFAFGDNSRGHSLHSRAS